METKFIGRDGFNEIENVSGKKIQKKNSKKISTVKKTIRFAKRLSAEISHDIEARKSKKRHAHSAPERNIIKKKAILTAMACVTAAILCCATVASALDSAPAETEVKAEQQTQLVAQAPAVEITKHNFN